MPAVLQNNNQIRALEKQVSELVNVDDAVFGASTLHLFFDFFGLIAQQPLDIYLDSLSYPIARWGVERAQGKGAQVHLYPHHDAGALKRQIIAKRKKKSLPVIVTDGFCTVCGKPAPVPAYLDLAEKFGGLLVIDDTQALGVLGHGPANKKPFGKGGGGSLCWHDLSSSHVVLISSLAKGFGVPIAVMASNRHMVKNFREGAETRVYCSPPSAVDLCATSHALTTNALHGDKLRARLYRLIKIFHSCVDQAGIEYEPTCFPVQTFNFSRKRAHAAYQQLEQCNLRAVLNASHDPKKWLISFVLTARHTPGQIRKAVQRLANSIG